MSKYYNSRINSKKPDASARCDRSGLICMHSDLIQQMEFQGMGLVWTGLWVSQDFADKPNPALMSPIIKTDPWSVPNPRPWQAPNIPWSNQSNTPWNNQNQQFVGWGSWAVGGTNVD